MTLNDKLDEIIENIHFYTDEEIFNKIDNLFIKYDFDDIPNFIYKIKIDIHLERKEYNSAKKVVDFIYDKVTFVKLKKDFILDLKETKEHRFESLYLEKLYLKYFNSLSLMASIFDYCLLSNSPNTDIVRDELNKINRHFIPVFVEIINKKEINAEIKELLKKQLNILNIKNTLIEACYQYNKEIIREDKFSDIINTTLEKNIELISMNDLLPLKQILEKKNLI